ncbi:hypothetical protein PPACK8108_LOCUS12453 [Phakopsora pachyrhizi]|uniref:Uncharacterized protein n=1 Tax=Phakopsora pachyrhizi TaxID=170000 RepID=A0AAV0B3W4_PHAPC|nr:hypothetical protein PPACK8108_LOCUS12453 [Phakopsora pachyrhizi]
MDGRLAMKLMRMMWKETQKIQRASGTDKAERGGYQGSSCCCCMRLIVKEELGGVGQHRKGSSGMTRVPRSFPTSGDGSLTSFFPSLLIHHTQKIMQRVNRRMQEETIEDRKELGQTSAEGFEKMIELEYRQLEEVTIRINKKTKPSEHEDDTERCQQL